MTRRHFTGSVAFGLVLGVVLALFYAWLLAPVDFSNADLADLRDLHKDEIIRMIAAEYVLDGDFPLARRQLDELRVPDLNAQVFDLARTESHILRQQALIHLYLHIQNPVLASNASSTDVPVERLYTPRPTTTATPRGTRPATPTFVMPSRTLTPVRPTPEPTLIPPTVLPNPSAPLYRLTERERLTCRETDEGVIQVIVRDANGRDLAGIAVEVGWETGHEAFYTGLKPEHGIGFADYSAPPGEYTVRLMDNAQSQVIRDLKIDPVPSECANSDVTRGWKLVFAKS